jgi:nitronate monooxygenase
VVTDDLLLVRLGIEVPIVQAPMAGSSGVELAIAVARAGGLGSLPAAMLTADRLE